MTDFASPETSGRVLARLHEAADVNGVSRQSLREIATACGIGTTTAHVAIKRLRAAGLLDVVRVGTGDKYPTAYRLCQPEGA